MVKLTFPILRFLLTRPKEGALNQLYVATHPDISKYHITGKYFTPVGEPTELWPIAKDDAMAEQLWNLSQIRIEEAMRQDIV